MDGRLLCEVIEAASEYLQLGADPGMEFLLVTGDHDLVAATHEDRRYVPLRFRRWLVEHLRRIINFEDVRLLRSAINEESRVVRLSKTRGCEAPCFGRCLECARVVDLLELGGHPSRSTGSTLLLSIECATGCAAEEVKVLVTGPAEIGGRECLRRRCKHALRRRSCCCGEVRAHRANALESDDPAARREHLQ